MYSNNQINQIRLHNYKEDGNILKKWIRVASRANESLFYLKLYGLIKIIKKERNITSWIEFREFLSKKLNANIDITTLYGLRGGKFNGKRRDGVPLKIFYFLVNEYCNLTDRKFEDVLNEFYEILDSVYSFMGNKCKLVKSFGMDLCYLLGMVVADGTCPNSFSRKNKTYRTYEIRISKDSLVFIQRLSDMFYSVFGLRPHIFKDCRSKNLWILSLKSKYIFRLFTQIFEIPVGKKSKIVRMPRLIRKSSKENQFAFIRGVIDGDGCIYSYIQKAKRPTTNDFLSFRVVLRVRSKMLIKDVAESLRKYDYYVKEFSYMGNSFSRDFSKKRKIKFYGLYLQSKNAVKYSEEIGSLNPTKIKKINEYYQKLSFLRH
ncbi:hypothetical protein HYV85_01660 [Candidatus Woesearchaeota archaeon]|nr:hypothetical protein [Candidatus Woesearchaeota archaeon]